MVVVDAPVLSTLAVPAPDGGVSSSPALPAPPRVSAEAPAEGDAGASEVDAGDPGSVVLDLILYSGGTSQITTMVVTSTGRVSINGNEQVFWTGHVAQAHIEAFHQVLLREHACSHQKRESGMSEVEVTATFPDLRCTSHWSNVGALEGPATKRFKVVWKAARELKDAACKSRCPDFSEGMP